MALLGQLMRGRSQSTGGASCRCSLSSESHPQMLTRARGRWRRIRNSPACQRAQPLQVLAGSEPPDGGEALGAWQQQLGAKGDAGVSHSLSNNTHMK